MSDAERIAVVETRLEMLESRYAATSKKVDEIHGVLMKANGARWAIVAVAMVVGFLIGIWSKLAAFVHLVIPK